MTLFNAGSFVTRTHAGLIAARRVCASVAVASVWCVAGSVHAADVYWNIGLQAPGAVVELANAPRVYYSAPPVVFVPAPVAITGWGPAYPKSHWRKHKYKHRHDHHGRRGDDDHWGHEHWDREGRYRD